MNNEEKEWIQTTLLEHDKGQMIDKILSIKTAELPCSNTLNFTSEIKKIEVQIMLKSGCVEKKFLIYKAIPKNEIRMTFTQGGGTFNKETRMYREVLPLLENLRKEMENSEPLWPTCFGTREEAALLFDDLDAKGYKMSDRVKGLDFQHCELVVRSLAKFHALASTCIKNGVLHVQDFKVMNEYQEIESLDVAFKDRLITFTSLLENNWGGEWIKYAEGIKRITNTISKRTVEYLAITPGTFRTLNHGDCWANNIFFKYGCNGAPEHVSFIDFQGSHYNHPGADITFFLKLSPNADTLPRTSELLQIYYSSLVDNLNKFGYPEEIPSYEDILEGYSAAKYYGLLVGLCLMPYLKTPTEILPDIEEEIKRLVNNLPDKFNLYDYEGKEIVNSLKYLVKEAYNNGALEI